MDNDQMKKVVAALLTFLATLLSVLLIEDGSVEQGSPDTKTQTIAAEPAPVPTAVAPPVGDLQVEPEPASKPGDAEQTLRDEKPDEVPADVLEEGKEQTDKLAGTELTDPLPVGGAQNYSVRKNFKCGAYSSRNGARATEFVLHFTVSPNRPGWGDVLGINDYFCRTKIASSTFITDFEANILQMMPVKAKPWTQGAVNPWAISVEIIATGLETRQQWLDSKLIKSGALASLARDTMRRAGIKIVRVDPSGCVFPPGYTDHNALECGNDHTDVGRNFPWDVFRKQVRQNLCNAKCKRARRAKLHNAVHARWRKLACSKPNQHPQACATLRSQNRRLHKAGV